MKKLTNYFFVAAAALTMVFTSCSKDDDDTALLEIKLLNDIAEAVVPKGGDFTIAGTITSEAGLVDVKLFEVTEAGEEQKLLVDKFDDKNLYPFQFTIENIEEDLTVKIQATDKDNTTSSKNFIITVNEDVIGINSYSITLGAQQASTGSSFASIDGTVLNKADAIASSNKVDFMYYYGNTNKATIAAPSDSDLQTVYTWVSSDFTTKNATIFIPTTVTSAEFDAVEDATGILMAGTASSASTDLSVGDVIAFKTAATSANPEKKGLAKVVSISAVNSGSIELAVKVSK